LFVRLRPKAVLALSMALHELATNAVKYGALSNATGNVEINWRLLPGAPRRLQLRWAESGGPPVAAPRRRGFGSRLVEEGLAYDLAGKAQLTFAREGLVCTIDAPLDEAEEGEPADIGARAPEASPFDKSSGGRPHAAETAALPERAK
jgi:two-component sensor histidine kinase